MPNLKLRQDTVQTLPYVGDGKDQCIYWDDGLAGFGLRVYPSGKRTYVCSYRVSKRKRLGSLGRTDALTLDEARRKARRYFGQAADNADPQAMSDERRAAMTVKELAELYLEKHAKLKKKTWCNDSFLLNRVLVPKLGALAVPAVKTADIETLHADKGAQTPGAANNFVKVTRKMFNWGKKTGLVSKTLDNPASGIVPFPIARRRRYVTPGEMPRFLAALEAEDNEFARHAIWLLLLTGVRLNELLRAKWTDVDWDFHTLFVGVTKNGEPVLAPLSEAALDRLRNMPRMESNPYIVCGRKPGTRLINLRSTWLRVRAAAGLSDVRLHDLRRTVGSWLVQNGSTLYLVGSVLNHKDPKTTAGYAYFQTRQREAALTDHGRKVMEFMPVAPSQDAATSYEVKPVSALPSVDFVMPKKRAFYVEREVLYRLVWEAPVSEVAERFGISDVGLAKACRRARIPVPARGYWAKIEAGIHLEPSALQPPPAGLPAKIRIRGQKNRNVTAAAIAEDEVAANLDSVATIQRVSEKLSSTPLPAGS